jgi:NADP-dependent 3-hydroxy acid dehydrogenase YdfG
MAQQNYKVIITARDKGKVTELSEKLNAEGVDTVPMELDILNEDSIKHLAGQIEAQYGKLDVLINNAGGFYDAFAKPLEVDFDFVQNYSDNLIAV